MAEPIAPEKVVPTAQNMPVYECHKIVRALQIATVAMNHFESSLVKRATISFVDDRFVPLTVAPETTLRYIPNPGDYYVVYSDGYQSFSPKGAFEDGYVLSTAVAPPTDGKYTGPVLGPVLGPGPA